jgi:uncharacterized protein (TIGR00106 family)
VNIYNLSKGETSMALVEISIIPLGTSTPSVSEYIALSLKFLQKAGLKYTLTPMGTVIEGNLDTVMNIVRQMHEACFKKDVQRVVTTIKIDDRRDKLATMENKVSSVQKKL